MGAALGSAITAAGIDGAGYGSERHVWDPYQVLKPFRPGRGTLCAAT